MILLPFLACITWMLAFRRHGRSLLEAALAALVAFGVVVSVATEIQGLLGMLTPTGSAVAWALAAGVGLALARGASGDRRAGTGEPAEKPAIADFLPVAVILALTAFLALVAAPNSYDGLTYHLVRVLNWIQQGSLRPFPAHDTRQLFMPSWPEYAILQFQLLSGGDRFANLVQWIGFAGAVGGAALLARTLGGSRRAAVIAAGLVATLPMAVAQASGTQTDLVAACWAVLTCAFGYRLLEDSPRRGDALLSAVALGLAMATKQTALLFGGAAVLPVLAPSWRKGRGPLLIRWMAAIALSCGVLAGPQLARNRAVFGNLRGDPLWLDTVVMTARGPSQVGVNLLRNLSVHFGTPSDGLNQAIVTGVAGVSRALGVDPSDPRTTWDPPFRAVPWSTHEEFASNPLHLLLIVGCCVALLWKRPSRTRLWFVIALLAGFVVFCAQLRWQVYDSRLQTPLFVLGLSLAAVMLEGVAAAATRIGLALLALIALPYTLLNYTRPLLTLPGGAVTPRPGVLSVPRNLHYFLYDPSLGRAYFDAAVHIADSGCNDVGERNFPDQWEYAVRVLVRNAGSDARFRNVEVTNASARFAETAGPPCLLLQIGPAAARPPGWAKDWRRLVDYQAPLGSRGIVLYAPPR